MSHPRPQLGHKSQDTHRGRCVKNSTNHGVATTASPTRPEGQYGILGWTRHYYRLPGSLLLPLPNQPPPGQPEIRRGAEESSCQGNATDNSGCGARTDNLKSHRQNLHGATHHFSGHALLHRSRNLLGRHQPA